MTAADGNPQISWGGVSRALEIYQDKGYEYVEAPWVVSDVAILATLPAGLEATRCQQGALVGSAEQSFVQLMLDGKLSPGRYVAATPCFRDENPVTLLHRPYFFKVELIHVLFDVDTVAADVLAVAQDALDFFNRLIEDTIKYTPGFKFAGRAKLVATPDGYDIELNGVELGSYGYRSFAGSVWVYGTGYADPRFNTVLDMED